MGDQAVDVDRSEIDMGAVRHRELLEIARGSITASAVRVEKHDGWLASTEDGVEWQRRASRDV